MPYFLHQKCAYADLLYKRAHLMRNVIYDFFLYGPEWFLFLYSITQLGDIKTFLVRFLYNQFSSASITNTPILLQYG